MTSASSTRPLNKWKWRAAGTPPPAKKPLSMKAKASIQAPLMALAGWALFHFLGHRVMPVVIWSLAGLILVGGWFIPALFIGFEKFGMGLGKWVGIILNWAILTPFYYLCFVPGRIILKVQGIDPMDRRFPDPRESFWIPRKPVTDMAQYRKQH